MTIKFENSYSQLPSNFFSPTKPAQFSSPRLCLFNHDLAQKIGLGLTKKSDEELAEYFSGQKLFKGGCYVSTVYAGHQFGHFNPQLGDGRAILIGEVLTPEGGRFDLQLKGAGPSLYSRRGDGLSAIGPVIREYIVSEAMTALGIPSTRAIAAVATGEMVYRQERVPAGGFTRLAASHIRIGSFEYFASRGDLSSLRTLTDYTIKRHYPECLSSPLPELAFFRAYSKRFLSLVAEWMRIGFIHGVMNTDNCAISGETLDFGPCAFMDEFKRQKVFSSIDHGGRYAFENQGPIALWNLSSLAGCLLRLIESDHKNAKELLQTELNTLAETFKQNWLQSMGAKIGLIETSNSDRQLIDLWLNFLEEKSLDFTIIHQEFIDAVENDSFEQFPSEFIKKWKGRTASFPIAEILSLMKARNPVAIPRNHLVEEAIKKAENGDYTVFKELHLALKNPYDRELTPEFVKVPPKVAERVTQTFCGT